MHVSEWQPPGMQERSARQDAGAKQDWGAEQDWGSEQDRASLRLWAMRQAAPRRWPGFRPGEAARGALLLAAILAATCAFLLLLDALGVPPGALADFPLVD